MRQSEGIRAFSETREGTESLGQASQPRIVYVVADHYQHAALMNHQCGEVLFLQKKARPSCRRRGETSSLLYGQVDPKAARTEWAGGSSGSMLMVWFSSDLSLAALPFPA